MIFQIINVQSYNAHRADVYPAGIYYRDEFWKVIEIVDRWYEGPRKAGGPVYNYFKIRTEPENVFIIRHNLRLDIWAVLLG